MYRGRRVKATSDDNNKTYYNIRGEGIKLAFLPGRDVDVYNMKTNLARKTDCSETCLNVWFLLTKPKTAIFYPETHLFISTALYFDILRHFAT